MNEEEQALCYADGIMYEKGQTCALKIDNGITYTFRVEKTFKLHGFFKDKIVVTIPITLDTLKGLGFISKLKGAKK